MSGKMNQRQVVRGKTKEIVFCGMFAALMAVCAWITVPTTVPFTLQTFAVFAALGILGGRLGTISVIIYILLGVVGLPVFSGFKGGLASILGVTGGYIVGFLVAALLMWGIEKLAGNSMKVLAVSMVLGILACYLFGSLWFQFGYMRQRGGISLMAVLSMCVFPFIIPDGLKIGLALCVTKMYRRYFSYH